MKIDELKGQVFSLAFDCRVTEVEHLPARKVVFSELDDFDAVPEVRVVFEVDLGFPEDPDPDPETLTKLIGEVRLSEELVADSGAGFSDVLVQLMKEAAKRDLAEGASSYFSARKRR